MPPDVERDADPSQKGHEESRFSETDHISYGSSQNKAHRRHTSTFWLAFSMSMPTKDYGNLYALGAHPFTLWSFTEAVWVQEIPREELVQDYREKAAKAGYPNFRT